MTEPIAPIEQQQQKPTPEADTQAISNTQVNLPRITIKYCTQCKWMLRAAYFAQELLSTFSTTLGEVSLIPTTGGTFTVSVFYTSASSGTPRTTTSSAESDLSIRENVIWDRKRDGGFPEVKVLKSLVRDIVDPTRGLGHTDRALKKNEGVSTSTAPASTGTSNEKKEFCTDCQ
ncbi:hypothetical protein MPDQ_000276 [Monascus purpureus]|uniref:Rdx family-domain-containing protein n=1 Tax=Monascus purpureus TaxID=5098 RepID=A0A507QTN9_MONPU|nr:hypothetical protein MPDQ_000276 [Monascus purpureus]BDD54575.1 hypothetical protein MAP00_000181 [Monascus purpureus]